MINFRFHLISLVAVFLALGVGVAMGASFIDRATVDSLRGRVDDLDDAAGPNPLGPAEPDEAGQGERVRDPARLHDDDVEPQPRVGEALQGVVQTARIGQAARAATAD